MGFGLCLIQVKQRDGTWEEARIMEIEDDGMPNLWSRYKRGDAPSQKIQTFINATIPTNEPIRRNCLVHHTANRAPTKQSACKSNCLSINWPAHLKCFSITLEPSVRADTYVVMYNNDQEEAGLVKENVGVWTRVGRSVRQYKGG